MLTTLLFNIAKIKQSILDTKAIYITTAVFIQCNYIHVAILLLGIALLVPLQSQVHLRVADPQVSCH